MGARDKHPQQAASWPAAHLGLKRLWKAYTERHPGITQGDFGKKYDIGSQSMVSQHMTAARPLNIEAATKYAKGFGCHIKDISPEMDRWIKEHLIPVLGPRSVVLGFIVAGLLQTVPQHSYAASQQYQHSVYYVKWIFRRMRELLMRSLPTHALIIP